MEEFDSYFENYSVEKQASLAKLEGISRDEYLVRLKEYEDYLANETVEQFEERMQNTPKSDYWTEETIKQFVNKMSINPQEMD
jgi:hypothetical protein